MRIRRVAGAIVFVFVAACSSTSAPSPSAPATNAAALAVSSVAATVEKGPTKGVAKWAEERFEAAGLDGVYIVITNEPKRFEVVVGKKAHALITVANRDAIKSILAKDLKDNRVTLEVESLTGESVRPALARAVVQAGWNLQEMRGINMSLEDIFLRLTGENAARALVDVLDA